MRLCTLSIVLKCTTLHAGWENSKGKVFLHNKHHHNTEEQDKTIKTEFSFLLLGSWIEYCLLFWIMHSSNFSSILSAFFALCCFSEEFFFYFAICHIILKSSFSLKLHWFPRKSKESIERFLARVFFGLLRQFKESAKIQVVRESWKTQKKNSRSKFWISQQCKFWQCTKAKQTFVKNYFTDY